MIVKFALLQYTEQDVIARNISSRLLTDVPSRLFEICVLSPKTNIVLVSETFPFSSTLQFGALCNALPFLFGALHTFGAYSLVVSSFSTEV